MTYHLNSQRPAIKLSEVTLKKILTAADVNFKFVVLEGEETEYISEIECINLPLNIQLYEQEGRLTFKGEKLAMAKLVSLIKEYYGSLSDFIITDAHDKNSLQIAAHTSEEEIAATF